MKKMGEGQGTPMKAAMVNETNDEKQTRLPVMELYRESWIDLESKHCI